MEQLPPLRQRRGLRRRDRIPEKQDCRFGTDNCQLKAIMGHPPTERNSRSLASLVMTNKEVIAGAVHYGYRDFDLFVEQTVYDETAPQLHKSWEESLDEAHFPTCIGHRVTLREHRQCTAIPDDGHGREQDHREVSEFLV